MNFFYEDFPDTIEVEGIQIKIVTDFREYIKLFSMLKDEQLSITDKIYFITQYFNDEPVDLIIAIRELNKFIKMEVYPTEGCSEDEGEQKALFSFEHDFAYIYSAFMHDYGINLRTVKYMHWWEFRMLFDGLSEDNEIKKRMMYRSIDLNSIKDREERKRIMKIQSAIRLPENALDDFDIGDIFA